MTGVVRFSACVISCFVLTACASNDLTIKRQVEADAKIEHLIQTEKINIQGINELSGQLRMLDDQVKASVLMVKQLQNSVQDLRRSQDELVARIDRSGQQAAVQKIEVVNQEPAVKGKDGGPPAGYLKAFGLYSANSFGAAVQAFEAFIKQSPRSDYVANAYYWIGECYYSQSNLPKARTSFQKTVESYPKSPKAPDAMLKLGYTLAAMKEKEKANAVFESIVKVYPGSLAAGKARERLMAK